MYSQKDFQVLLNPYLFDAIVFCQICYGENVFDNFSAKKLTKHNALQTFNQFTLLCVEIQMLFSNNEEILSSYIIKMKNNTGMHRII